LRLIEVSAGQATLVQVELRKLCYLNAVKSERSKVITSEVIEELLVEADVLPIKMKMLQISITNFTSIENTTAGGISYLRDKSHLDFPIHTLKGLVIFGSEFISEISNLDSGTSYIIVEEPKYLFAFLYQKFQGIRVASNLEQYSKSTHKYIHSSTRVSSSARIHRDVVIGKNSVISDGVSIYDSTVIGDNVHVKDNSVIGGSGFGYAVRAGYPPLKIPHLGGVIIGDNVDIGSCSTIDRGTFASTIISEATKIDNGVHIAHNVRIGKRTIVIAHAEISGSVEIGEDCWIAPNVSIREKVKIGNNVLVGLGSVVIKDIGSDKVVAGVPARPIRKRD
jgi:UDP-3-O-[3-hydroxymyristoyl] glucosamine N-acyltransferase LpxD